MTKPSNNKKSLPEQVLDFVMEDKELWSQYVSITQKIIDQKIYHVEEPHLPESIEANQVSGKLRARAYSKFPELTRLEIAEFFKLCAKKFTDEGGG